jgi:NAD(P)-dependent dehydrogenase (short-subunit alcohol dehydrogenase family)
MTPVNIAPSGQVHPEILFCGGFAMNRLSGKVAMVTGGSVGIGAACARRMVEAGARVAIVDVHDGTGQELAAALGESARYFHADVAVEADVAAAISATVAAFGRLDVLVNNAASPGRTSRPTNSPRPNGTGCRRST